MTKPHSFSRRSLYSAALATPALLGFATGLVNAEKFAVEKDYLKHGFSGVKVETAKQLAACC
ncbi:MAG: hypothetical protein OSA84_06565 [Akkermansiaceae bacterium]|nr:hypothetical protein [Akkermansiaceae bacterium]